MTAKRASEKERQKIAADFLKFRQTALFTQRKLAESLHCSRRAVQYAESGCVMPQMWLRQRFRDLQKEYARREREEAA